MAPIISVVTTCKGRLEHLKATLPAMLALPGCEVIVVDYDCPDGTAAWVRANHPAARVVQVTERPIFNAARARNLGAAAAAAPWLLMLDADVLVSPGLAEAVRTLMQPGVYMLPAPRPPELYGVLGVARADFDAIGGYDENFEGWGSEDVDITVMLDLAGKTAWPFPGDLVAGQPHGDDLRVRFHEIADRDVNWAINAFYHAIKIDLRRVGMSLNPEQARNLYAGARRSLLSADGLAQLNVVLPERTIAGNKLEATITYRLSGPGTPPRASGQAQP